jgi:hypothetical protein
MAKIRIAYKILARKPQDKGQLGRRRHKWKDIIMILKKYDLKKRIIFIWLRLGL